MGGSAKPPQQSANQAKLEDLQMQSLKAQLDAAKKPIETPKFDIPKPLPPLAPPIVQTQADQFQAAQDARRKAASRINAGRNTLFAGDTGAGRQTLLG